MRTLFIFLFCITITQNLRSQQDLPVAVNDSLYPIVVLEAGAEPVIANLLLNDYDPLGQALEITEVEWIGSPGFTFAIIDSSIVIQQSASLGFLSEQVLRYRARRVNDTMALSNWAFFYMNAALDPDFVVAHNDTTFGIPNYPVYVNVLKNDYHPLGDSVLITFVAGGQVVTDSAVRLGTSYHHSTKDYFYLVSDTNAPGQRFDVGTIHMKIEHRDFYDSLNVNNINARFNCFGLHFWDFDEFNQFRVPNGSTTSSIFSNAFWIGGLDPEGDLHLAGERYRGTGVDYWWGPVSEVYDSLYDIRWFHVWKLNRSEIEYHKANWWTAGYEPIEDIATWPGNGDTELGQSPFIAPFDDQDGDGIYEPLEGDAPRIKGDQALFFVFNDQREQHTESHGIPLGIEVRTMAYAFDSPDDSALWNTIFLRYEILNQSDTAYHDVYLGAFTDLDLGYAWDDRVECDVKRGMYFAWNGTEEDGIPEDPFSYGHHPPAQGVQFLGGAYLDPDGIDNPKFDINGNQLVDYSINGLGFGDGIIDNERLGMTHFIYFSGSAASWVSDPHEAHEFYSYLQAIWLDNTELQYGGYGHPTAGSTGPDCNFQWPRDTDPLNWGTGGIFPNGGYNQNNLFWSSEEAGMNPGDIRGLGSSGPFTLEPGQTQTLDLAFPWARDYDGTAWESALLLKDRSNYIKELFEEDTAFFSRIDARSAWEMCRIYPNPAKNFVRINVLEPVENYVISISDMQGRTVFERKEESESEMLVDLEVFPPGIYILRVKTNDKQQFFKLIKQ